MGCATSKQKSRLCRNCHGPCSPPRPRRSSSVHYHHPPTHDHHLVLLTSSSLESFRSESFYRIAPIDEAEDTAVGDIKDGKFMVGLIEAKTWSKMIDEKMPKVLVRTPTRTPPGEPEMINAWELMEGLEDISPLRPDNHVRSFSFDFGSNLIKNGKEETGELFSKPMWLELADNEIVSKSLEFDPNIISTFREAFRNEENSTSETEENREILENKELEAEKIIEETAVNEESLKAEKKAKSKLVLYFTSLRGVRKTYEDCCHVKMILKSIRIKIDERDVSMHSAFKEELKELLADEFNTSPLPRVFLGDNYIGGADEIRQMHEEGRLEKMLLEDVEVADGGEVCEACGDVRFVPCERCSGSCKIYYEDECGYEYDGENENKEFDESEYGFQRCLDCNENGLVRCPICCD